MKAVLFSIVLLLSTCRSFSQDIEELDSLFNYHFNTLNDFLDKHAVSEDTKVAANSDDMYFLFALAYVSDFRFELQGYFHHPMINKQELKEIEVWYKKHREELNATKMFGVINTYKETFNAWLIVDSDDPSTYDLYLHKLDSLDSDLRRLSELDSYLPKANDSIEMKERKE